MLQRKSYGITGPSHKLKASAGTLLTANTEHELSHQELYVQGIHCSPLKAQQCLKQFGKALALFPQQIESAHRSMLLHMGRQRAVGFRDTPS